MKMMKVIKVRAILLGVLILTLAPVKAAAAAGSEVQEFMPLRDSREWNYRISKVRTYVFPDRTTGQELEGTSAERCTLSSGVIAVEMPVFVLTEQIKETNRTTGRISRVTIETYMSSEPDQILVHAQRIQGAPGIESELENFVPPPALLKLPLPKPGEPYPSLLKAHGLTLDSRPYDRGRETIETPAGTFEDCLRISSRGPVSGELPGPQPIPITEGSLEETTWFAKGVGIVKQVQVLRMQMALPDGQQLSATEEKNKLLTGHKE
jgi:hypothetical protein